MFPGVYGFDWSAGQLIFLGVFYAVVLTILATLVMVVVRAVQDRWHKKVESIRWHADFEDLPGRDRRCRHELDGTIKQRTCPNGFDCRACIVHAKMAVEPVPDARMYHRGHTWVQPEADGTFTVGLDEFATRVAGKPDSVTLPQPGEHVEVNGTAWRLARNGAETRVLSPVDGEVVETGSHDAGWYLRVKPAPNFSTAHLLRGAEVQAWTLRELERLQALVGTPALGPTLADGGELVDDLGANCPKPRWDTVLGGVFLEP